MAFGDVMRNIADVILNNKLITFLSVALFAFIIATIALAGQNNSNADALAECEYRLQNANPDSTTTIEPVTTTMIAEETTTVEAEDTTTTVSGETTTVTETTTTIAEETTTVEAEDTTTTVSGETTTVTETTTEATTTTTLEPEPSQEKRS
ncbi:mucin-22-like [Wyeomyia smithii]|uniref:mucin-22-like n=1 Tax=Wyeomyia smithii TaxID=174621 RepID=UPI002467F179|nr:mucin-22-like [Wyeomyia smithii]